MGGVNLKLFLDCTCKYSIDASINSIRRTFLLAVLREFSLRIGPGVEIEIKDKN
jgi:hypothetical protein